MSPIDSMSREELLKLVRVYAKNWLAHDGCWFLAVEETLGLATAIEMDARSWHRFAVAEARRLMKEFEIPAGSGLAGLEKALGLRLYSAINEQSVEWIDDHAMIFRMIECRVQKTRAEKSLPPFPCKPVGMVEFSQFARTVDPRIRTSCVNCPPDERGDCYCAWRFEI